MIAPGKSLLSRALLWIAVLAMGDGAGRLMVWLMTGQPEWYYAFFRYEGALLLMAYPLAGMWLSLRIQSRFEPGQFMQAAWRWIALSAAMAALGAVLAQWLGVDSQINPLVRAGLWSQPAGAALRNIGLVFGGPAQMLILALGLAKALATYRQAGFAARLSLGEKVLLAAVAIYMLDEFRRLALALSHGKHPGLFEILNWPTDPLLWVLLAQALLLRRSVLETGTGLIGKVWVSFSAGISVTVLGDVGIWAGNYGVLSWPWTAVFWLVWLPAAAAFAVGAAYQWEAIQSTHAQPVFTRAAR